jgi:hypothetical protein
MRSTAAPGQKSTRKSGSSFCQRIGRRGWSVACHNLFQCRQRTLWPHRRAAAGATRCTGVAPGSTSGLYEVPHNLYEYGAFPYICALHDELGMGYPAAKPDTAGMAQMWSPLFRFSGIGPGISIA